ncbi:MAG: hypothetical protein QXX55_00560 [Candidatus Pacearchaeota archaeon]
MVKKCIYCKKEIPDESVIDFCSKCGVGVWGERMFKVIVENMEAAKERGDINKNGLFVDSVDSKEFKKFN